MILDGIISSQTVLLMARNVSLSRAWQGGRFCWRYFSHQQVWELQYPLPLLILPPHNSPRSPTWVYGPLKPPMYPPIFTHPLYLFCFPPLTPLPPPSHPPASPLVFPLLYCIHFLCPYQLFPILHHLNAPYYPTSRTSQRLLLPHALFICDPLKSVSYFLVGSIRTPQCLQVSHWSMSWGLPSCLPW